MDGEEFTADLVYEKLRGDKIEALTNENSALSAEITRLRKLLEEHVIKVE